MSYILEALKKSDKERKRSKTEQLDSVLSHRDATPHEANTSSSTIRIGLLFLLFCVMIAGTIWLTLTFISKNVPPTTSQNTVSIPHPPTSKAPKTSIKKKISQNNEISLSKDQKKLIARQETKTIPPVEKEPETVTPAPKEVRKEEIQPTANPEEPFVPFLTELPETTQAKVPKLKFAGHVYSKQPAQRLIMINRKIVREGDMVETDLRLEEITHDGVILRYEGTRFRVAIL